jgi:hypothetical protein
MERGRVSQRPHRLVLRRREQGDRPCVVVAIESEYREGTHRHERTPNPAGPPRTREVPRVVDKIAVFGILDRAAPTNADNPLARRTAPTHRVHHQIGADVFARRRSYTHYVGTPWIADAPVTSSRALTPRSTVKRGSAAAIAATVHSITGRRPVTNRSAESPERGALSTIVGGSE